MVGMKERKLAVVERAARRAEPPDLFDERVLRGGVFFSSRQLIKIAERGDKFQIGQAAGGLFLLLDGAR